MAAEQSILGSSLCTICLTCVGLLRKRLNKWTRTLLDAKGVDAWHFTHGPSTPLPPRRLRGVSAFWRRGEACCTSRLDWRHGLFEYRLRLVYWTLRQICLSTARDRQSILQLQVDSCSRGDHPSASRSAGYHRTGPGREVFRKTYESESS